jgi:predicted O-methyltransferase YrrM
VLIFIEYIKYQFKARGKHGTHSPFVYNLVNECLTTKIDKNFISDRKKLFKSLKRNQEEITITDYGVGSKKLGLNRKVSAIFNASSSKGRYGNLLYRLSSHYHPATILELGTSLGIGSLHLINGNKASKLITVEGCPETQQKAAKNFQFMGIESIQSELNTFQNYLTHYRGVPFDMVFIDGHHDGEALIEYLKLLTPFTHNDTLFLLDDIRWNDSMLRAWSSLIEDPHYHVSLDLFRMGIILPRHQQQKEHFTLRF